MTTVLSILKNLRCNCPHLVMALRHLVCSAGVCVLMGHAVAGQSFAQTPSGTVVAVVQPASAKGPGGSRVLKPRKPVFEGDRINTGPVGEVQIHFRDGTRLVVGPNSSLTIDGPAKDRTAREVGINFAKGTFRFIGSNSAKQAYSIRTPTGTIAIGLDGEPRGLSRTEIARPQNGCSEIFRNPRKYNPDTVAVCSLLASL